MKKVLTLFAVLVLAGTFLTGWTFVPWGSYNSDGEMLLGVGLKGQAGVLTVEIDSEYDVNNHILNLDSLWSVTSDYGFISVRGGFTSEPLDSIDPFVGFLFGVTPVTMEALTLKGLVGTGLFTDDDFGKDVFPTFLANPLDVSILGIIETGYSTDDYTIRATSSAGYHFDTGTYGVRSGLSMNLWSFVDVTGNILWLPTFEWDVFVRGTFEF